MEFITVTDASNEGKVRINTMHIVSVHFSNSMKQASVCSFAQGLGESIVVTARPDEIAALDWWTKHQDIDIVQQHKRELYFENDPAFAQYVQECRIFNRAILPYSEWQEAVKRDEEYEANRQRERELCITEREEELIQLHPTYSQLWIREYAELEHDRDGMPDYEEWRVAKETELKVPGYDKSDYLNYANYFVAVEKADREPHDFLTWVN